MTNGNKLSWPFGVCVFARADCLKAKLTPYNDLPVLFSGYPLALGRCMNFKSLSSNVSYEELVPNNLIASPLMKPYFTPGGGGQEAKCVNWKVSVGLYWVLMPQMESWTNLRSPFTKRENGKKVQWCFDVRGTRANHDAPFDSNTFLRTFIRAKWQTRLRRNEYLRLWDCGDGGISGNAVSILCLSIDWLAILTAAKTKSIFILVRNSNMHGDSYYGVLFNFIPPWQIRC